jgi:hypothetical protein
MEKIPEAILRHLRRIPCEEVLKGLDFYHKRDLTFKPIANRLTKRVYVSGSKFEGELIVTGPKFFCPALGKGGCGSIDLLMFLDGATFFGAVIKLVRVFDVSFA